MIPCLHTLAQYALQDKRPSGARNLAPVPKDRFVACAVQRRRFPVGERPTRRSLPPEATGAVMEVTKWLKPAVKRATNWWQREGAGRNASER